MDSYILDLLKRSFAVINNGDDAEQHTDLLIALECAINDADEDQADRTAIEQSWTKLKADAEASEK